MNKHQHSASLRQRLRCELQRLHMRDLEQQSVAAVRVLLNGVHDGPLLKSAVQELLSDLGSNSKHAVKLRLQLTEYCILKCATRKQLPLLVPLLLQQANNVLTYNGHDASCISGLAALMSSVLTKMLHEAPPGSPAQLHSSSSAKNLLTADTLCDSLLFPIIKSTYRNPEHTRVSAGSVVLLSMLEVMKECARQHLGVQDAIMGCLVLMVHLLGSGSFAMRVPGVLLPVAACLEALGARISADITKRVLLLCEKGAVDKEVWQVRRDALQTLQVLTTVLQPTVFGQQEAAINSAGQQLLDFKSSARGVLVARKHQMVQTLEDARYDKIPAVRTAAAAALAAVMELPDPESAAKAQPSTATSDTAVVQRYARNSMSGSSVKKPREPVAGFKRDVKKGPGSGGDSLPWRFCRPQHKPGTVLDYGIQVFAPPSPPKGPSRLMLAFDAAHGSPADQSPVKQQLMLNKHAMINSSDRLRQSMDASSQTNPADQGYTVQSPSPASRLGQTSAEGLAAAPCTQLSAEGGCLWSVDASQLLDQSQLQAGLSAVLAAGSGARPRLDVSHHVHGRVELGVVYRPLGSPLRTDIAAAMAAATFEPPTASGQDASASGAANPGGGTSASSTLQGWWVRNQQQATQLHHSHPDSSNCGSIHLASRHCSSPSHEADKQQQQSLTGSNAGAAGIPSFCNCLATNVAHAAATAEEQPAACFVDNASGAVLDTVQNTGTDHIAPLLSYSSASTTQPAADSVPISQAAGVTDPQSHIGCKTQSPQHNTVQQHDNPQLLAQAGTMHDVGDLQPQQELQQVVLGIFMEQGGAVEHQQLLDARAYLRRQQSQHDQQQEQQKLLQTHLKPSVQCDYSSSATAATDPTPMCRPRQRWRLPGSAAASCASDMPASGDSSPTGQDQHSTLDHSSRVSTRVGSSQHRRGNSREGFNSVPEGSDSLDALRNVGERVQGLLEALTNGKTKNAGDRCGNIAAPTEQMAAAEVVQPTSCSALCDKQHSENEEYSSDAGEEGHMLQSKYQRQVVTTPATCGTAVSQDGLTSAGSVAHGATPAQPQAGVEGNLLPCLSAAEVERNEGDCSVWQQTAEPQQKSVVHDTSCLVLQSSDPTQPSICVGSRVTDADQSHVTAVDGAVSNPLSGEGLAGLEQVEKALQKLHTLRSTLQSIGGSGASARQTFCTDSNIASTAATDLTCKKVDSGRILGMEAAACANSSDVSSTVALDASPVADTRCCTSGSQLPQQQLQIEEVEVASASALEDNLQHDMQLSWTTAQPVSQSSKPNSNQTITMACTVLDNALHLHQQLFQQPGQPLQQQESMVEGSRDPGDTSPHPATIRPHTSTAGDVLSRLDAAEASCGLQAGLSRAQQVQDPSSAATASWWGKSAATNTCRSVAAVSGHPAEQLPAGPELQQDTADLQGVLMQLEGATGPEGWSQGVLSREDGQEQSAALALANSVLSEATAAACSKSTSAPIHKPPDHAASHWEKSVSRLQHMLDASSDTALLMSLAYKLDSLAKKFNCQGAVQPSLILMSLGRDEMTDSMINPAAPWTSVMSNSLFVPSPANSEGMSSDADSLQQQRANSQASIAEQHVIRPVRAERGLGPDPGLEGCSRSDDLITSGDSAAGPWLELHDTAMQQVFGIDLQQLQHGGQQVAQQVAHVAEQLRQQLQTYSDQPAAGMSSNCCLGLPGVQHNASVAPTPRFRHFDDLEPLLMLLLHAYAEAVQQQCRILMKQRLQHHQLPVFGWEKAAKLTAQKQMQWFVDKQLHLIVQYLEAAP